LASGSRSNRRPRRHPTRMRLFARTDEYWRFIFLPTLYLQPIGAIKSGTRKAHFSQNAVARARAGCCDMTLLTIGDHTYCYILHARREACAARSPLAGAHGTSRADRGRACGAFIAVLRNHAEIVLAHANRQSPKSAALPVRVIRSADVAMCSGTLPDQ
jgi:hypothetical protein